MNPEEIAHRLGGASKSGNEWSCRCPAHDDRKASLSITERDGKILFHCHAGCPQDDVFTELKILGLLSTSKAEAQLVPISLPSARSKVIAQYDYVSEDGELLFQALRHDPKDFRQRRPDSKGGWVGSIKGVRRVLYRLPDVIKAVKECREIYICEGEKDVEAARSIGLVATCNPMGADNGSGNKFLPEFADWLIGATVIVVPDQDEPGRRHGEWVIKTLTGKAAHIGRLDVKVGKDFSDWIEAGATVADIEGAIVDASEELPEIEPQKAPKPFLSIDDILGMPPVEWLVYDVIPKHGIGACYGPSSSGKSFLITDLLAAISKPDEDDRVWFGNKIREARPVVYVSLEGWHGIPQRFKAYLEEKGKPGEFYFLSSNLNLLDPVDVGKFIESLKFYGLRDPVICIDTLNQAAPGMDENSSKDMSLAINALKRVQAEIGGVVIVVHHTGKDNAKGLRGHSSLRAALDFSIEVNKSDSGERSWTTEKMKDGADDIDFPFKLKIVDLGEREDGKRITSCVVIGDENARDLDSVVGKDKHDEPIKAITVVQALAKNALTYEDIMAAIDTKSQKIARTIVEKCATFGLVEKADPSNKRSHYIPTQRANDLLSQRGFNLTRLSGTKPFYKRCD